MSSRWNSDGWWLDPIPPGLRGQAVQAAESGNSGGFLCKASNDYGLDLVFFNTHHLKRLGLYERALLGAFGLTRVNNFGFGLANVRRMFERADRERLIEAGDALPGSGPFTLYRGVGGNGRARHVRGLSWTASLDDAKWFAHRAEWMHLPNPAVYSAVVNAPDVLAYINDREEQEFIVLLPKSNRPKLLLDAPALRSISGEITAWREMRQRETLDRITEEIRRREVSATGR